MIMLYKVINLFKNEWYINGKIIKLPETFICFRNITKFPINGNNQQNTSTQNTSSSITISETKPATKKSLDELYALNKAEFKSKPGKYTL